ELALARYSPDGHPDPSLGGGGEVVIPLRTGCGYEYPEAVTSAAALQADGKIVTVGTLEKDCTVRGFGLTRVTASGRLDPNFGRMGEVRTFWTDDAFATSLAIQRDGKIVAAGAFPYLPRSGVALARFRPDGTLDS